MPILPFQPTIVGKYPTPKGDKIVFNPDRTDFKFTYGSKVYNLPANTKTKLPVLAALHAVDTFTQWGVMVIESNKDLMVSKAKHKEGLRIWAQDVMAAYYLRNPHLPANSIVDEPEEVVTSREILEKS